MRITNQHDISLTLAVWAVNDDYEYTAGAQFDKPYISVTTLMRPAKQLVLAQRVPYEDREEDVEDRLASAVGNSIHDSVEKAWKGNYKRNLEKLGIPQSVIDRVAVNPSDDERRAKPDMIPIFLEQRAYREIDGYVVGGKFDNVMEGHVEDTKTTSAYVWLAGTRDEEHQLQLSFYRWIDEVQDMPKIEDAWGRVNYVFTDWQKAQAKQNPAYPPRRTMHKDLELLSSEKISEYVRGKLAQLKRYSAVPESDIPPCTDADLWRSDPQYKYYSDPAKASDPTARSSKNFSDLTEANKFRAEKGKGVVVTKLGEPRRCPYCPAFPVCNQRKDYYPDEP